MTWVAHGRQANSNGLPKLIVYVMLTWVALVVNLGKPRFWLIFGSSTCFFRLFMPICNNRFV